MIPWPKSFNTMFNAFDIFNLKVRLLNPSMLRLILSDCGARGIVRGSPFLPEALGRCVCVCVGRAQVFTFPVLACVVRSTPVSLVTRSCTPYSSHLQNSCALEA